MTIQLMENVGIVVDDLAAATAFFVELGLELQGEGPVEGDWVDRVVGLEGVRVNVAMLETLDGHGRLELMKFHAPTARGGEEHAPANTLGIRRIAFAVDDIDAAVAGLQARGTELVGEVERYEDSYRLCYVRGPEGIIVMLAEQIALSARDARIGRVDVVRASALRILLCHRGSRCLHGVALRRSSRVGRRRAF
jgi:catechol 2,3-dioxygenase-like lactoylglutathione lyase family enzyme